MVVPEIGQPFETHRHNLCWSRQPRVVVLFYYPKGVNVIHILNQRKRLFVASITLIAIGALVGGGYLVTKANARNQELSKQRDQVIADQTQVLSDLQKRLDEEKVAREKTEQEATELKKKQDELEAKQKEAAKVEVVTQPKIVDPFPSAPDYSGCPQGSSEPNTISMSALMCSSKVRADYERAKEAWYARNGQSLNVIVNDR